MRLANILLSIALISRNQTYKSRVVYHEGDDTRMPLISHAWNRMNLPHSRVVQMTLPMELGEISYLTCDASCAHLHSLFIDNLIKLQRFPGRKEGLFQLGPKIRTT